MKMEMKNMTNADDLQKALQKAARYVQCPKCQDIVHNTLLEKNNHFLNYHDNVPYASWQTIEWVSWISIDDVLVLLSKKVIVDRKVEYEDKHWTEDGGLPQHIVSHEALMLDGEEVIIVPRKQLEEMVREFQKDGTAFLQKYGYCQIKTLLEGSK